MKDSTETLLMLAELLEAEPPILPPEALQQVQTLAAELETLSEANLNQVADLIITWIGQFPREQAIFEQAKKRELTGIPEPIEQAKKRELTGIPEPSEIQRTFPNFQVIEETETTVLITPTPQAEKTSLVRHIKQSLKQWTQNNR
ncbi:hypothetical protein E1H12_22740 [Geitlerinema sp. P-1104]|uniref:hypothetical protein n=1 Tax=Geitlerinema sp. P-1104 TaxID=2546230 RepID=UPI0014773E29|nr:hypothetical protein [Geitlerinema sp. P-1104]NMG61251.1 hypothetical protein [Geitlerinema sp. P-1104]